MGKGTITGGGTDGQYQLQVNYNKDLYNLKIETIDAKISTLTEKIVDPTTSLDDYNIAMLQRTSLQNEKSNLEAKFPDDKTISVWCADMTEDLTGEVGLIEVPGESQAFNIQPGHEANAAYNSTRDGQLVPTIAQGAAQTFYNMAMLPGWQKWKPTFRYGTISNIDNDENTCTVTLDAATSSQQSININQATVLQNVTIEYMSCNSAAFGDGDIVLVQFVGQEWSAPKVIGFMERPKPCSKPFYLRPTIDGNALVTGGQKFFIRYTNSGGIEEDTSVKSVHGGNNPAMHGYCGPFDLLNWDGITDIKIFMKSDRDAVISVDNFVSPMFSYFKETGDQALWSFGIYDDLTGANLWSSNSDIAPMNTGSGGGYNLRLFEFRSSVENSTAYTEQDWTLTDGVYFKVEKIKDNIQQIVEIYNDFTAGEYSQGIETQSSIYNHSTGEYETDASILDVELSFGLKRSKRSYYYNMLVPVLSEYCNMLPCLASYPQTIDYDLTAFPNINFHVLTGDGCGPEECYYQFQSRNPWLNSFKAYGDICYYDGVVYPEGENAYVSFPVNSIDEDAFKMPNSLIFASGTGEITNPGTFPVQVDNTRTYRSVYRGVYNYDDGYEFCIWSHRENKEIEDDTLSVSVEIENLPVQYF